MKELHERYINTIQNRIDKKALVAWLNHGNIFVETEGIMYHAGWGTGHQIRPEPTLLISSPQYVQHRNLFNEFHQSSSISVNTFSFGGPPPVSIRCLFILATLTLVRAWLCHAITEINTALKLSEILIPNIRIVKFLIHIFLQFFHSFLAPGTLLSISLISISLWYLYLWNYLKISTNQLRIFLNIEVAFFDGYQYIVFCDPY